jgi:hypothetical protein
MPTQSQLVPPLLMPPSTKPTPRKVRVSTALRATTRHPGRLSLFADSGSRITPVAPLLFVA